MASIGSRKEFFLWTGAAVAAAAVLATVLIVERGAASGRTAILVAGNPEKGAQILASKGCSICHSINGSGGRIAPDLAGRRPGSPAMSWLTTVLWNHAPGMWRQMRMKGQA